MALSEFEIIDRFFTRGSASRDDVVIGVGDDAAQVRVPEGHDVLVDVSTAGGDDTADTDPASLGHRSLALALARLAARGGRPAWLTIALTRPLADERWLEAFSSAMTALADRHGVQLVGGDTTRGPARLTLHLHALARAGEILSPGGARVDDLIYVTGALGDGALAVLERSGELALPARDREPVLNRARLPEPPVREGLALRALASSAMVLAGGVAAALRAPLSDGGLGATIQVQRLPLSDSARRSFERAGGWSLALHSEEPCALAFTVAPRRRGELEQRFAELGLRCSRIGTVEQRPGLRLLLDDGSEYSGRSLG